MERDQVCLGFSLALVTAVSRHGVQLPLLLDDPFVRLDDRGLAALASVLDDIGRRGQQLLVFTGEKRAADRFASLGAAIHSLVDLRHWPADRTLIGERPPVDAENGPSRPGKPKLRSGKSRIARAKPGRASKTSNRSRAKTNRSDAA
jgi:hypothetical protein